MSEYWKSTPKYWCKHCACYVRDTKLERANHEATGRHQGALKRSLRNLHREHERGERDKERAQREIARLNGVVVSSGGQAASSGGSGSGLGNHREGEGGKASEWQLRTQREQLAALGVAVPGEVREEMAMPGEWTVTSTRILEDKEEGEKQEETEERKGSGSGRKRGETEDEEHRREEEEAMRGLFKRPRRWGRDSRTMPEEEDGDLEALLSTMPLKSRDVKEEEVKEEVKEEVVKEEVKEEEKDGLVSVKEEPDTEPGLETAKVLDQVPAKEGQTEAVIFKKRKPKTIRSK